MVSRRDILRTGGAALMGGLCAAMAPVRASEATRAAAMPRLRTSAPPAVVPYGAAVKTAKLYADPAYTNAILQRCSLIVGEGGMKWYDLRPDAQSFSFDEADRLAAFATRHRLELRGHTLVWYGAMPEWTKSIASGAEAGRLLTGHIETVVGRYRGVVREWDVINEPMAEKARSRHDLREGIFQQRIGPRHIGDALKVAASTDPACRLVINEYDIEFAGAQYRAKREAFKGLIMSLLDQGVPLHGIGLQGHLRGELEIDTHGLSQFVADIHAMGLEVSVTELDVIDHKLPGPEAERDAAAAARVRDFLGAIFAAARPAAILTWGISDAHTWVPMWFKRSDGLPNRPLPLDFVYRAKPMMRVIDEFRAYKV